MSEPGNRIRFAGTCGVLHEIIIPYAFFPGIMHQRTNTVQLVIPGKDHVLDLDLLFSELFILHLEVDEPRQDVKKAVPFQDFLPEVGGFIVARVIRIASAAIAALVEGKEPGVLAGEACGHVDLVRIYGKMDKGTLLELEYQVRGITVRLVLSDSITPCLAGHLVLELYRCDRDPVE